MLRRRKERTTRKGLELFGKRIISRGEARERADSARPVPEWNLLEKFANLRGRTIMVNRA